MSQGQVQEEGKIVEADPQSLLHLHLPQLLLNGQNELDEDVVMRLTHLYHFQNQKPRGNDSREEIVIRKRKGSLELVTMLVMIHLQEKKIL